MDLDVVRFGAAMVALPSSLCLLASYPFAGMQANVTLAYFLLLSAPFHYLLLFCLDKKDPRRELDPPLELSPAMANRRFKAGFFHFVSCIFGIIALGCMTAAYGDATTGRRLTLTAVSQVVCIVTYNPLSSVILSGVYFTARFHGLTILLSCLGVVVMLCGQQSDAQHSASSELNGLLCAVCAGFCSSLFFLGKTLAVEWGLSQKREVVTWYAAVLVSAAGLVGSALYTDSGDEEYGIATLGSHFVAASFLFAISSVLLSAYHSICLTMVQRVFSLASMPILIAAAGVDQRSLHGSDIVGLLAIACGAAFTDREAPIESPRLLLWDVRSPSYQAYVAPPSWELEEGRVVLSAFRSP